MGLWLSDIGAKTIPKVGFRRHADLEPLDPFLGGSHVALYCAGVVLLALWERLGMIKLVLLVGVGVALALAAYIRLAPSDPARWHEDPRLVSRPASPNFHLIRMVGGDAMPQVFQMPAPELARRIDEIARADGATRLAGSPEAGHITYISRTRLMGYPDYTSVLVEPAGDGAMLLAFARSRFGHSDLGVNRARLERWLSALAP